MQIVPQMHNIKPVDNYYLTTYVVMVTQSSLSDISINMVLSIQNIQCPRCVGMVTQTPHRTLIPIRC